MNCCQSASYPKSIYLEIYFESQLPEIDIRNTIMVRRLGQEQSQDLRAGKVQIPDEKKNG